MFSRPSTLSSRPKGDAQAAEAERAGAAIKKTGAALPVQSVG